MYGAKIFLGLVAFPLVLFADPQVTSWFTDNADTFAEVRELTGSAPVVLPASSSRLYTVQTIVDLTGVGPVWSDIAALTDMPGVPNASGEMSLVDTSAAGDFRFYRVRARVP